MKGIIVCGSRDWEDAEYIARVLYRLLDTREFGYLVQGGAPGADSIAGEWADAEGFVRDVNHFQLDAEWHRFGGGAGPIRNGLMLTKLQVLADDWWMQHQQHMEKLVVAFHPDIFESKGTANMVKQAQREGVEVRLFSGR